MSTITSIIEEDLEELSYKMIQLRKNVNTVFLDDFNMISVTYHDQIDFTSCVFNENNLSIVMISRANL